ALTESIFPERELDIQKKNSISKLAVNEKKNSYLCKKNYYQNLYGKNHPYASFSSKETIKEINQEQLLNFHQDAYLNGLKYLMVSGKFEDSSVQNIIQKTIESGLKNSTMAEPKYAVETSIGKHFIEKSDSVQSALRIGKLSISRNHSDFRKLQFLNLIFGGYFGSRLMKNIREDKGLTYGIYSVIEPSKLGSNWYIDTDINSKNRDLGLKEIFKELSKIREELIPEEEINLAKNYYLGSFLKSLDGPFSLADRLKIIIDNQLSATYYPEFVSVLNETTAKDLQELANKYFDTENIVEIIVGKK
ncbi:MAG: insulinase family protein, partial [Bacteroidia bacterium]|nr:insulinase family protein [Bacteroidia bacterium]